MYKWELTTLDKLGTFNRGKQTHYPKNDPTLFENGNIPFVETQDCKSSRLFIRKVKKFYNQKGLKQGKLFPINTVCISSEGNIADSALLSKTSCLSCHIHGFNSYQGISDPKFIKYCFDFSQIKDSCLALAKSATTRLSLTTERLKIVKFPYPLFQIQQKIGDILSAYDELSENNERQIELLEALRTYFYKKLLLNNFQNNWKRLKLEEMASITKGTKPASHALQNQYIYIYIWWKCVSFLYFFIWYKKIFNFLWKLCCYFYISRRDKFSHKTF
ncbi:restriction endonuclease subunit S [Mycoplasma parvum]|uniref:Type I restriction modification DNA specificity domain-containing protein n=1 Tax=Mycoplasma parvum str. Indiana TaxID=1403316 RepID=U5NC96_9MOLU|nr:restriction endonuclease subunit S [Mycoplasma parvum]AGX89206.1 hypothetical protein PRV_02345 [Mycoplasma parvum str. Indiana]